MLRPPKDVGGDIDVSFWWGTEKVQIPIRSF